MIKDVSYLSNEIRVKKISNPIFFIILFFCPNTDESTRVAITNLHEPENDYINANFVKVKY
jgi:hypothetical protein